MIGVIMYGPPAAGKSTVTEALSRLNPEYQLFRRLKVGYGRTEDYRMTTDAEIEALRANNEIIWENRRYDSAYFVDRHGLAEALMRCVPVVHLGQVDAIASVLTAVADARWLLVSLWCPRDVAEERIVERNTGDTMDRLNAWDATDPVAADIAIDTAKLTPSEAAQLIDRSLRGILSAAAWSPAIDPGRVGRYARE